MSSLLTFCFNINEGLSNYVIITEFSNCYSRLKKLFKKSLKFILIFMKIVYFVGERKEKLLVYLFILRLYLNHMSARDFDSVRCMAWLFSSERKYGARLGQLRFFVYIRKNNYDA